MFFWLLPCRNGSGGGSGGFYRTNVSSYCGAAAAAVMVVLHGFKGRCPAFCRPSPSVPLEPRQLFSPVPRGRSMPCKVWSFVPCSSQVNALKTSEERARPGSRDGRVGCLSACQLACCLPTRPNGEARLLNFESERERQLEGGGRERISCNERTAGVITSGDEINSAEGMVCVYTSGPKYKM
jgi:hypothetical protein